MPRTRPFAEPYSFLPQDLERTFAIDGAKFADGAGSFEHSLFAPIHYEPGYAYPLVVLLDGSGDERQLRHLMPLLSLRNYVAVSPRGLPLIDRDAAQRRFGWRQNEEHIQRAQQRVFDCVEIASRQFNVARNRVFLMGTDRGGTMAMRIGLSHPSRFAGVISLRGALPRGGTPFGNLLTARRLSLFVGTDRGSQRYPAARVCEDLRLLHAAGLSITLREYPRGRNLLRQMLADVDRWLINEVTAQKNQRVESHAE
ncbi:MAG: alpha/beta hydrolase-fold protein [Thermoguttaceae bacterium]